MVILDGLSHPLFPLFRYEQLAQLSPLPPNQVETGVQLAAGTTTTRFATTHVAEREAAAEEAGGVDDLRQAGAASTVPIRELRAGHRASNLLYTIVYKKQLSSRAKTGMRICYPGSEMGNSKGKRNLPYTKISDAESLGQIWAGRGRRLGDVGK